MFIERFIHREFGYCYFIFDPNPTIYNLYIEEEYRGKGLSKVLLKYCIDEIRNTGYVGDIFIEVTPYDCNISQEKLARFYKNNGLKFFQ